MSKSLRSRASGQTANYHRMLNKMERFVKSPAEPSDEEKKQLILCDRRPQAAKPHKKEPEENELFRLFSVVRCQEYRRETASFASARTASRSSVSQLPFSYRMRPSQTVRQTSEAWAE